MPGRNMARSLPLKVEVLSGREDSAEVGVVENSGVFFGGIFLDGVSFLGSASASAFSIAALKVADSLFYWLGQRPALVTVGMSHRNLMLGQCERERRGGGRWSRNGQLG